MFSSSAYMFPIIRFLPERCSYRLGAMHCALAVLLRTRTNWKSGTLPTGITLTAAGVISGTATAVAGSYPITLRVTDSSTGSGSYFELENFTVNVSPRNVPEVSVPTLDLGMLMLVALLLAGLGMGHQIAVRRR